MWFFSFTAPLFSWNNRRILWKPSEQPLPSWVSHSSPWCSLNAHRLQWLPCRLVPFQCHFRASFSGLCCSKLVPNRLWIKQYFIFFLDATFVFMIKARYVWECMKLVTQLWCPGSIWGEGWVWPFSNINDSQTNICENASIPAMKPHWKLELWTKLVQDPETFWLAH